MRKFLDFVVRDDRPILTPPSEDESGSEQLPDHVVERQECSLKHELEKVLQTSDGAKIFQQTSHQSEVPYQSAHSEAIVQPEVAIQENLRKDKAIDNVISSDVYENSRQRAIFAKPVLRPVPAQKKTHTEEQYRQSISESPTSRRSRPRVRELLSRSDDRLRHAARVLSSFASDSVDNKWKSPSARLRETQEVVSALREIAETMVWADQHEPTLWDTFMECSIMTLLLRCLRATVASDTSPGNLSPRSRDSATGDSTDVSANFEASHRNENNQQRANENRLAGRTGKTLPDMSEGWKQQDSTSRLEHEMSVSSLNTGDLRTAYSPISEGLTEVAIDNNRTSSAKREVSQQIALEVQSQVLQSLSIMIQSIFRQHSLLCLFSSNHINEILSFGFRFEDDEMLGYFMSAVKTIALKLDPALLQLFFDPSRQAFPLYNTVVRFFDHREQMVRIAVRNITLTIYALGDQEVLAFAARDETMYLFKTVDLLAKLCGSVARAFELLMDDGREVRRTRSRTGIFRQKVRVSEVTGRLEEMENLFAYLSDVSSISTDILRPLVVRLLESKLFVPFFRPVASRASPRAVQLQRKWRLTNTAVDTSTPALAVFDAAARCLLLAFVLETCKSSCLAHELMRVLKRRTSEFEGRSVLHALKAMASDITGTERASFVSLCAIEAFILCGSTTREVMRNFKFDIHDCNSFESVRTTESFNGSFADGDYRVERERKKSVEGPLLLTLSEFEAPLTPSSSVPSTPSYVPPSPSDITTPPKDLTRVMSATSLSTGELAAPESSESDGVLMKFQLGEASLREVISSVLLVVRRREVRTLRIVRSICRILKAASSKTNSLSLCREVPKIILDEIAAVMLSFLRNKQTTIVSIERMFENFRSVAEQDVSDTTTVSSLETVLSPDAVPKIAANLPKGAGKRRRSLKDDATPPTETEDAVVLFVMLNAYEKALDSQGKAEELPKSQAPKNSKDLLSTEVREVLLKCSVDESYLDKRDALEDVASIVLRHRDVN